MAKTNKDELLCNLRQFIENGLKEGKSYGDIYLEIDMLIHDAMYDVEYGHMLDTGELKNDRDKCKD